MSRLFSTRYASYKARQEEKTDYKSKIFIAFEGGKTEPTYFTKVSKFLNNQDTYTVEVFPVDRSSRDGKSHPKYVRDGLIEFYEKEIKKDFLKNKDTLGIVIDIDKHFESSLNSIEKNYHNFLETLKIDKNIEITPYICNPSFELWLILQLVTADKLDLLKIKENKQDGKLSYIKKTYKSYNKVFRNINLQTRIENVRKNAESSLLEHNITHLWREVGTNLNELFDIIFDDD